MLLKSRNAGRDRFLNLQTASKYLLQGYLYKQYLRMSFLTFLPILDIIIYYRV